MLLQWTAVDHLCHHALQQGNRSSNSVTTSQMDRWETVLCHCTPWNMWRYWLIAHLWYQAFLACITADTRKHLSGNGTTDIGYWEHFHVTSMCCNTHVLLYLLSNMETLRKILGVSLPWVVEGFGEEASGVLRNDCMLFRRVAPSFSQWLPHRHLIASPMMLVFKVSTKCPTVGLSLEPKYKRIAPNVFTRGSSKRCCQVFAAAPSWKNIKKEISGLPYMMVYHISSDLKITQITLQGTDIKRCVFLTLFLIVKSSPPGTVAERSRAWIVFARADAGTLGSNPTLGMYV
jgi:hypothetical protein